MKTIPQITRVNTTLQIRSLTRNAFGLAEGEDAMNRQPQTWIVKTASHKYCTTDFACECEASQQEFDQRGIDNSSYSYGVAQSEKTGDIALSRKRQTWKVKTALHEYCTTDFALLQ